jgi:large repetitive protein
MKRASRWATIASIIFLALFSFTNLPAAPAGSRLAKPDFARVKAVSPFEIDLTWRDHSDHEDGFQIERSTDRTHFRQIAQVLPGTTIYRDKNLFPGTRYFYRIRAFNASGASRYDTTSARTVAPPVPVTIVVWNITPAFATNAPDCVSLVKGGNHVLELHTNGTVTAWGDNSLGQSTPPTNLTGVVAIAAGYNHSLALKEDGTVVGWGETNAATPPSDLSGVVRIAAGGMHSLALKADGTVVGWGNDDSGQAMPPSDLSGVVEIAAGFAHSLALKSDGTIAGWGTLIYDDIVAPTNATGVVAIEAGFFRSFAVRSDGTVIGWGDNIYGNIQVPTDLTDVATVASGDFNTVAVKKDGALAEWGMLSPYGINHQAPDLGGGALSVTSRGYESTALSLSPASPSVIKITVIALDRVHLSWQDNSIGEKGFQIERALAVYPIVWTPLATVGSDKTNFTDKTLAPGSAYMYRIRAFSALGNSPFCQSSPVSTSPLPPNPPNATLGASHQVNLTLSYGLLGADGFKIERAPDNNGTPGVWTEIASLAVTNNTFADTNVTANTTNWYRLRAFNSLSISSPSEPVSVAVVPPIEPVNFFRTDSTNQVGLIWADNNAPLPEGFKIERATDTGGGPGAWVEIANLGPGTTFYGENGLTPDTYYYRIHAYNWVGDSPYSGPIQIIVYPTAVPIGLNPSLGLTQQIQITWGEDGLATQFELQRAPDLDGNPGSWTLIAVLDGANPQLPFSDTNVVANATYWYRVRALSPVDVSDYCNPISISTVPPVKEARELSVAMDNRVKLFWSYFGRNDVIGFSVERALDAGGVPGTWQQIDSFAATNTSNDFSLVDTNVVANTIYWYRVRTSNWVGLSDGSDPIAIDTLPPLTPASFYVAPYRHTVEIAWWASLGAFGFAEVERAPDLDGAPGNWTVISTNRSSDEDYLDTNLVSNTTYWYRVRAANWAGYSDYTTPASATIAPPTPPIALSAIIGVATNTVEVSWTYYQADEDAFRIEFAPDNNGAPGAWTEIALLPATNHYNSIGFTATNAAPYTTNWYRVRAFNDIGTSDYCTPASIALVPPIPPPTFVGVINSSYTTDLFWSDYDQLVQGYKLERALDNNGVPGTWLEITNISGGFFSWNFYDHPPQNLAYSYRVRAYNWIGDSAYTDPLTPNPPIPFKGPTPQLTISSHPQILSLTPTNGGMLIEWSSSAGNTDVVQASENFNGDYTNLSPALVIGSGITITNYFDAGAATNAPTRFYRIRSAR